MGAAPAPGILTIDPDATYIGTYGRPKEGSAFSYKGEVQMSPLVGVVGETGDVLALRARGANAHPTKKLAGFTDECVAAIPKGIRPTGSTGGTGRPASLPGGSPTWGSTASAERCATSGLRLPDGERCPRAG
jgi:hypothetical protein